ncbi:MAG: hypothetical protein ABFS41_04765, partial [Myxococcota bacterium]
HGPARIAAGTLKLSGLGPVVSWTDLVAGLASEDGTPIPKKDETHFRGHWLKDSGGTEHILQEYWPNIPPEEITVKLKDGFVAALGQMASILAANKKPHLSFWWVCVDPDAEGTKFGVYAYPEPPIVTVTVMTPIPKHLEDENIEPFPVYPPLPEELRTGEAQGSVDEALAEVYAAARGEALARFAVEGEDSSFDIRGALERGGVELEALQKQAALILEQQPRTFAELFGR